MVAEVVDAAMAKRASRKASRREHKSSSRKRELKQFELAHVSNSGDLEQSVASANSVSSDEE